jgi:hypothetical protein
MAKLIFLNCFDFWCHIVLFFQRSRDTQFMNLSMSNFVRVSVFHKFVLKLTSEMRLNCFFCNIQFLESLIVNIILTVSSPSFRRICSTHFVVNVLLSVALLMLYSGGSICSIVHLGSTISIWRTFGSCSTLIQCRLQYCQGTYEMDS